MGKTRRLNKLISKWIKSDLPDDRSSVLLLRVTRTPSSPKPTKRPFSLPSALGVVSSCSKAQVRRNSSSASNGRRSSVGRRDSRRESSNSKGERPEGRRPKSPNQEDNSLRSKVVADDSVKHCEEIPAKSGTVQVNHCLAQIANIRLELKEPDIPIESQPEEATPFTPQPPKTVINDSNISNIRKTISDRRSAFLRSDSAPLCPISFEFPISNQNVWQSGSKQLNCSSLPRITIRPAEQCKTSSKGLLFDDVGETKANMETSVDSIGKCSLNMEESRELPADWSEVGSTGTLCGSKVLAPQVERRQQHHHLPSYLSLACTVNGYSTTTNYDPVRLARSRDASPHRIDHAQGNLTTDQHHQVVYSVTNHLLSPPNLVPLPTPKTTNEPTMSDEALRSHQPKDYFYYTKTVTFFSNESHHYSNSIEHSKDTSDGCARQSSNNCRELFAYSRTMDGNIDSSTTISKEYTNGKETKSFIQQRVERLYGPGALAQGFFVSKRQKSRLSECEETNSHAERNKLNKTLPDKLSDEENIEPVSMRQSNSSPSLPVLRHLRPEFRAQLPLASPRKVAEVHIQKSVTVPKLTHEPKVNGVAVGDKTCIEDELPVIKQNGSANPVSIKEDSSEKDGHYFLKILEEQSNRLLALADSVDSDINNPNLSEEVIGKLRSASGKAKLLVSQKMQQFKGLCTNNINQHAEEAFPTTNQDLQGFWDMVMLQVDQVDRIFEEISRLRDNNWIEETTKKPEVKTDGIPRPRKTVAKPKMTAGAEQARKLREEQRKKMIEDRRKAMKAQQTSQPSIKIFVPESS